MTAAVTDPYVTAAEYKARVSKTGADDDIEITAQLLTVSRFLDLRLGRFFTQDAAVVTRIYDGNGETCLWLPDDIATSTGLVVKVDLDGDYSFADETALTLDTDFWLGPPNADKGPEPFPWEILQVNPNSGQLSEWPDQARAIQVTAKFGFPTVPGAIKEATISITRQLRDAHLGGAAMAVQDIEMAVSFNQQLADVRTLLWRLQQVYRKGKTF
jgi:hypothetical protein